MKAAVATWPQAEKQARFAALQQEAANTTNPLQYAEVQISQWIHVGYECDHHVFLHDGIARLRVAFPKLILVQVVASIVTVIYLNAAPLLPTFDGTVAKVIVIPCSVAAGIGLVCNILVFPYVLYVGGTRWYAGYPRSDARILRCLCSRPQAYSTRYERGKVDRTANQSAFDLQTLGQNQVRKEKSIDALNRTRAGNSGSNSDQRTVELGQHQIDRAVDFHVRSNYPSRNVLIKEGIQSLVNPGEHLIEACKESLQAISEALNQAHALRKNPGRLDMQQRHAAVLSKLCEQRDIFMTSTSRSLPEISRKVFDEDGLLRGETGIVSSFTGLMPGILLQEHLSRLADAIAQVLTRIVQLEGMRTKVRVWFPSRLIALSSDGSAMKTLQRTE
ncbi:Putative ER transporter, 6TM, N-terminal [Fusarium oxysporum f. sp. vasinfectum]|nr:Putative ER transporter, 6TM, N-terminal [Fusarium oxysporum f. sp. vasinfectum]